MQKTIMLLTAAVCLLLTGCAHNTVDHIVEQDEVGADDETFEETEPPISTASTDPTNMPDPTPNQPIELVWTEHLDGNDGVLSVDINIHVEFPSAGGKPIYEINPSALFSQVTVDKMIHVCFGDVPLYQIPEPTVSQLKSLHEMAQEDYQSIQEGTFPFDFYNEDHKEVTLENIQIIKQAIKYNMKTAPQQPLLIPTDTQLKIGENGLPVLECAADLGGEEFASLEMASSDWSAVMHFKNEGTFNTSIDKVQTVPIGDLTISQAAAQQQADAVVAVLSPELSLCKLSIYAKDYPFCNGIDTGEHYAHVFIYTTTEQTMLEGSQFYTVEYITIKVNDNGVREVIWKKELELADQSVPETQLLPFDEIKGIIKQELIEGYQKKIDDFDEKWESAIYQVSVDRVCLWYARVLNDGDMSQQQLVPVWNVYGTVFWQYNQLDNKGVVIVERPRTIRLMRINAIDGTLM